MPLCQVSHFNYYADWHDAECCHAESGQYHDTQHNNTHYQALLSRVPLCQVSHFNYYADWHDAECCNAECRQPHDTQYKKLTMKHNNPDCHYAECHILSIVMLGALR